MGWSCGTAALVECPQPRRLPGFGQHGGIQQSGGPIHPACFKKYHDLVRQSRQAFQRLCVEDPRFGIDDAQGFERKTVPADERDAGVGTNTGFPSTIGFLR